MVLILLCCFLVIFLIDVSTASAADELYVKKFGDPKNPAVIFIHGGPGYNCFMFEASAAALSKKITYKAVFYNVRILFSGLRGPSNAGRALLSKTRFSSGHFIYFLILSITTPVLSVTPPVNVSL